MEDTSHILDRPSHDPTPIFEYFRGIHATELLTAAVAHFQLFDCLAAGPLSFDELRRKVELEERPAHVLFTALRAMGLLTRDAGGAFALTPLASEHLVSGAAFDVSGYVALAAENPSIVQMVGLLRANQPFGASASTPESAGDEGVKFIFREGEKSAMEETDAARWLTLSLAGRARNVAPALAEAADLSESSLLLDVGGGSGIYSIACLKKHPDLRAVVWDRPEVLKVAEEFAREFDVAERLDCVPGDMFVDAVPAGADVILLSNILHDWDVPECRRLIARCAASLQPGGRLLIHDVFLNDELDGPLPLALYSASLFFFTEGRAYSRREYTTWLEEAGLQVGKTRPTLVHCGVLPAVK